jgi:hypothetical protein
MIGLRTESIIGVGFMNINDLLNLMADLDNQQLEHIKQFIDGMAYKVEGRTPTLEECEEILQEIKISLSNIPQSEDNIGLNRLKQLGFLQD